MARRKHNEIMLIGYRPIGTPAEDLYETCAPGDPSAVHWHLGYGARGESTNRWRPSSRYETREAAQAALDNAGDFREVAYSDDLIPDKGPRPKQSRVGDSRPAGITAGVGCTR